MEMNAPFVCPGFQLNHFQGRRFFCLRWETSEIISHPTWISQFPIPGNVQCLAHGALQTSTDKGKVGMLETHKQGLKLHADFSTTN